MPTSASIGLFAFLCVLELQQIFSTKEKNNNMTSHLDDV